jgi:hypothetical protein
MWEPGCSLEPHLQEMEIGSLTASKCDAPGGNANQEFNHSQSICDDHHPGRCSCDWRAIWMYLKYVQKKRTQKLRSKFGREYDEVIIEHLDRGHAESELQKRATRVAKYNSL